MQARPRILLVPALTELEWHIKPLLEQWAEVACYDAPGVGSEPPPERFSDEAIAERGVLELERRGWSQCVVVGDEWGTHAALLLASSRPSAVRGVALGHACLGYWTAGARPPTNANVHHGFATLMRSNYRSYVLNLTQLTGGERGGELFEQYLERVPQVVAIAYGQDRRTEQHDLEPLLRQLNVPLLLAKHESCLGFTDEGYDDVVAAFPSAITLATSRRPSVSPEFADALRSLCAQADFDG